MHDQLTNGESRLLRGEAKQEGREVRRDFLKPEMPKVGV